MQRQRKVVEVMLSMKGSHYGFTNPPPANRLLGVLGLPNAAYLRPACCTSQELFGSCDQLNTCSVQPTGKPKTTSAPKYAHGNVEEGCNCHGRADRPVHWLILRVFYSVLHAHTLASSLQPSVLLPTPR